MKCDKILFGLACLGLGYLTYSTVNPNFRLNKSHNEIFADMPKIKPQLKKDTLELSSYIGKSNNNLYQDSIKMAEDSLRVIKKIK